MVLFPSLGGCACPPPSKALVAAAMLLAAAGRGGDELLDELVGDYLEDAPAARRVAEVRAGLLRRGGELHARILVSAQGARVDAVPGLSGVQGHNLRTAEELHRLLRDGRLAFVLRGGEPVSDVQGSVAVSRVGRLPVRSIVDGSLQMRGATRAEWPLEVAFEAGPLTGGEWRAYVLADEVPRLRVVFEIDGDGGRVAELRSLGQFHDLERPR